MAATRSTSAFDVETWFDRRCLVVEVAGDVDVYTCGQLRRILVEASADGHHRVVIELAEVTFLDSSGLGVLVGAVKRARQAGGQVVLVRVPERILRVLGITGLTKVFPVCPSIESALDYLDGETR